MTRGKYGAKAANRLAALDNDLIQQKVTENEALKALVAELSQQLTQERSARQAEIIRRSDEVAADEVRLSHERVSEAEEEKRALGVLAAEHLVGYVCDIVDERAKAGCDHRLGIIPTDIEDILSELVGSRNVGEYLSRILTPGTDGAHEWKTRRYRRLSKGKVKHNRAANTQPKYTDVI